MQPLLCARRSLAGLGLLATVATTAFTAPGCGGGSSSGGGAASTAAGVSSGVFAVLAVEPADGDVDVALDASVRITLSGEVDPASVTTGAVTLTGPGGGVPGRIGFARGAGASSVVTFTPGALLAPTTRYEVRVAATVRDTAGSALGAGRTAGFTTGAWRGLLAGAASVDITPPIGVPLGGFGDPPRRQWPPDLNPADFHCMLKPSLGVLDPIRCKTLVLETTAGRPVAIMTMDLIATAAQAVADIQARAVARGVPIALDDIMVCSSHTHSGPGALSPLRFWELAAMDFFQRRVYDAFIDGATDSLVQAWQARAPARLGADSTPLLGMTRNRRAGDSNVFTSDSIDPELGVLRVDRADGAPIATLWNFAAHGLVYQSDNLHFSADLFGHVARYVEGQHGGGVCLFANGAEGDVTPHARGTSAADQAGQTIAAAILGLRQRITTTSQVDLRSASEWLDLGAATLAIDTRRIGRSGSGNSFIQAVNSIPGVTLGLGISLGPSWIETRFRFQAIRLNDIALVSIPGEAIHTIGLAIKAHGVARGFRKTFPVGLANGHMAYITTPEEYDAGGYESLATLFGRDTGTLVVDRCARALDLVR